MKKGKKHNVTPKKIDIDKSLCSDLSYKTWKMTEFAEKEKDLL